jgi:hypothetical protein
METGMEPGSSDGTRSPAQLISARITELGNWRGELLARLRSLIHTADRDVVEEWKWRRVPVWSHDGIITTGETYEAVVKLTFAGRASMPDPSGLFNSSLEGNMRRAIDFHQSEAIDEAALIALVRTAATLNQAQVKAEAKAKAKAEAKARPKPGP